MRVMRDIKTSINSTVQLKKWLINQRLSPPKLNMKRNNIFQTSMFGLQINLWGGGISKVKKLRPVGRDPKIYEDHQAVD